MQAVEGTAARILDTRVGNGAPQAKVAASGTVDLQVLGRGGVPATDVAAVVVNVTVTSAPVASAATTVTATSFTLNEYRQVPTGTTPFESTFNPFEEEFFGDPAARSDRAQQFLSKILQH